MAPSVPNPNWPTLFAEGNFGDNPFYGTPPALAVNTDLAPRLIQRWSVRRGKQFELDTVQAAEWNGYLVNKDGYLDPSNTASGYAPGVLPFRGWRLRAQYPASVNLVGGDCATGGEVTPLAAGTSGASSAVTSAYGTPVVAASGTAWQGTQVWQVPVAGGATTGSNLVAFGYFGVQAGSGASYTVSYHVRSVTTGANPVGTPFIRWVDINGNTVSTATIANVTLTGSPTASWTAVAQTSTVPANAVALMFGLTLATAPGSAWNLQADGIQLEQNTVASTFSIPGQNYGVFTGVFERFPQSWNYTGTYGYVQPVGVDAFAIMSQKILPAAFVSDILALNPNFLYQLNDPTGSTSCADTAGKRVAAPVENSPYGAGSIVFGNSITSTTVGQAFVGTLGPIATFNNNPNGSGQAVQENETFISIHKTTGVPGPPPNGNWTRVMHFRCTTAPTSSQAYALWSALPPSAVTPTNSTFMQVSIITAGATPGVLFATVCGTTGTPSTYQGTANLCDGNWHQFALTVDGAGNTGFYVDGSAVIPGSSSIVLPMTGITADAVGASIQIGAGYYRSGVVGDMACIVEIPSALSAGQVSNLYTSWRNAWTGDSSGARYSRILGWAGYTGASSVDAGSSSSLGPASDVAGADALTALQDVVNTENGQHFVSKDGVVTFQARTRRYGQLTPTYTFGDANPLGAEIPYELVDFDYDPTRISNYAAINQSLTNQVFLAQDLTSQGNYGTRNLIRNNQSTLATECQDAASYLVARYKDPHLRVVTLRLHPSANPSVLWPVCLSLELGMRVRVMRRSPSPAPTIQLDGFIEEITHSADDNGEWVVELQVSSADLNKYWQLAALHTTLNLQATSGQNLATINALPDAAVNKLAQSLPSGYSLRFEPGTARDETLVIAPGGIPSTTLGYTTAQLTFTTNFAFTHNAGTVVCEPLPTGFTDPTTWDSASVIGASYAKVVSGGTSGTATVTVSTLADSAVNGLGSDWNTNDSLWISAGTGNFESVTILSVGTSYLNYASDQITMTANFAHSHSVGDYVSDPLPAGITDPTTLTPTAKLAY